MSDVLLNILWATLTLLGCVVFGALWLAFLLRHEAGMDRVMDWVFAKLGPRS